ncbi:MAG: argininosuccinate synthase [Chloroflexi bacterium]|nr:argininosuccinate synthase [Chloroflexota bacterium]MBV9898951.1 argininosuccinate synthase [Chloroflexota bacterium]
MAKGKVVLAYSGGLDTSVAIRWINEKYDLDVIAVTVDVGNEKDFEVVRQKALRTGAIQAFIADAKEMFVRDFVFPSLQAGTLYQNVYPLATALARPLIAKILIDYARREGATHVAHGCTGKGNDQVRFDVSIQALAPEMQIIAPVREWRMTRDEEIRYAQEHSIPVPVTAASPYSVDANLWGRSIEAGVLEDPWNEPPEDAYAWTINPRFAPEEPTYITIDFEKGIPVALGDDPESTERVDGVTLVTRLNELAGAHGVGRIDHIEDRLVGIKSREVYEAPAAMLLHAAHSALEGLTLSREQRRFKEIVAQEMSQLIYDGRMFSPHFRDLSYYVASTQRHVTGTVRVRLLKGQAVAAGRRSPQSLYDFGLATYETGDQFDHDAAVSFIKLFSQGLRTQARVQLGAGHTPEIRSLVAPTIDDDDAGV